MNFRRIHQHTCWGTLLAVLIGDFMLLCWILPSLKGIADCSLVISVPGPKAINAKVGSNVTLNLSFAGGTNPLVVWKKGELPVATGISGLGFPDLNVTKYMLMDNGSLVIFHLQLSDSDNYTVTITKTNVGVDSAVFTLRVFESPPGSPVCSVQTNGSTNLQYRCQWPGGVPESTLSFQGFNSSGNGDLSVVIPASQDLNGKLITCFASHPLLNTSCSVTAQSPPGSPVCSVQTNGRANLQYRCQWTGGAPESTLSFQAFNSSGNGNLSVVIPASQDLNGKRITCFSSHPLLNTSCSVAARGPAGSLPSVSAMVDGNQKLVVTIACGSTIMPLPEVEWFKGNTSLVSDGVNQISSNTTLLTIHDFRFNTTDTSLYSCNCRNPLGQQKNDIRLLGPTINDSGLIYNRDLMVVTLNWTIPYASIITGFDIQMTGPDLKSSSNSSRRRKRATEEFRSIRMMPGSAQSTNLSGLDPKSSYCFRVVPSASNISGEPSKVNCVEPVPASGLSQATILGLAIGIPLAFLFLLILILIIVCCVCCKKRRREREYPAPRTVEKVQPNMNAPHNLLTGGLGNADKPSHHNISQVTSDQLNRYPSKVTTPTVRAATTV